MAMIGNLMTVCNSRKPFQCNFFLIQRSKNTNAILADRQHLSKQKSKLFNEMCKLSNQSTGAVYRVYLFMQILYSTKQNHTKTTSLYVRYKILSEIVKLSL